MARITIRFGVSVDAEGSESIVGSAVRAYECSDGEKEILYGDRSARRVPSFSHTTKGHLYAVKDVVESILESGILDMSSPIVLDIECSQKNIVEELSLDSPSHKELETIWLEIEQLLSEFYSIHTERVENEEMGELKGEALRATRNLRDRGVESTDELLQMK